MIKQAGLLILSVGVLVYFIAPVDKEPEPEPVVAEAPKKPAPAPVDDSWGDDESDGEFVFGQPLGYSEDSESTYAVGDDVEAAERAVARPAAQPSYAGATKSAGPKRRGGPNGPIDLTPPGGRK